MAQKRTKPTSRVHKWQDSRNLYPSSRVSLEYEDRLQNHMTALFLREGGSAAAGYVFMKFLKGRGVRLA